MLRARQWVFAPAAGNVTIEFAIVLPLLLLFVLGIIDAGRLVWTYTTLSRAVEAAARCASVNTILCATATQIQDYAVTQAWGLPIKRSAFTTTTQSCGVQVRASHDFIFIFPRTTVTLNTIACYPL